MTLLTAGLLTNVNQDVYLTEDEFKGQMNWESLSLYMDQLKQRYSLKFVSFIDILLEKNEEKRLRPSEIL